MHASQAGAVSGFSIQGRSQILSLNITLSSYPKQNGLAKALREISCIELTLCMPDWLRDPALRRRVQPGLNKGESPNAAMRVPDTLHHKFCLYSSFNRTHNALFGGYYGYKKAPQLTYRR